jgi:hypothetical protein
MKLWSVRCERHVAQMGKREIPTELWRGVTQSNRLDSLGIDGRITLICNLKKQDGRV